MRFLVLILALMSVVQAQKVRFSLTSRAVLEQRFEPVPATEAERQARIESLFRQAGCKPESISEQNISGLGAANVVCRLTGQSPETIIVGANYGPADPDNWRSAALLPSIYQALAGRHRRHTFLFVAFADQKRELTGSQFFADQLSAEEVDRTEAMVNLDALGLSPTKVSSRHSDAALVKALFVMVYALRVPASQVDLSRLLKTDAEPFAALHIPHITIHSIPLSENSEVLSRDFHPRIYYDSYHLIVGYVAFLDEKLKPRRPNR